MSKNNQNRNNQDENLFKNFITDLLSGVAIDLEESAKNEELNILNKVDKDMGKKILGDLLSIGLGIGNANPLSDEVATTTSTNINKNIDSRNTAKEKSSHNDLAELELNNSTYELLQNKKLRGILSLKSDFSEKNLSILLSEKISIDNICDLFNISRETFNYLIDLLKINVKLEPEKKVIRPTFNINYNREVNNFFKRVIDLIEISDGFFKEKTELFLNDILQEYSFKKLNEFGVPEEQYRVFDGKLFSINTGSLHPSINVYDIDRNEYFDNKELYELKLV